jgi:hypothetical protein
MTHLVYSRICRLALAFAMTLSASVAPPVHAASHDPAALALAELERHAELAAENVDHGRSHVDGQPEERRAGHSHEHDPTDHTHEVPVPADWRSYATPEVSRSWSAVAPPSHGHGPSFGIERPPRS